MTREFLSKLAEIFVRQEHRNEAVFLYGHALGIWEKKLASEIEPATNDLSDLLTPLFDGRSRDAEVKPFSEDVRLRCTPLFPESIVATLDGDYLVTAQAYHLTNRSV